MNVPRGALFLALVACSGCFLLDEEPEESTGCDAGQEEINGSCVALCPDREERASDGTCQPKCVPGCAGRGCLEPDECGTPCEEACLQVRSLADPALETILTREHPCFAWDAPGRRFLLQGGRRSTSTVSHAGNLDVLDDRGAILHRSCRLAGSADQVISVEDDTGIHEVIRSEWCKLDPSCWSDAGCAVPDTWENVDQCDVCYLGDTWALEEDDSQQWNWRPLLPSQATAPIFQRGPSCVSTGAGGIVARVDELGGGWAAFRYAEERWTRLTPSDPGNVLSVAPIGGFAWVEPGPDWVGGELVVGTGVGGTTFLLASPEGVVEERSVPESVWVHRSAAAVLGDVGRAFIYGGEVRNSGVEFTEGTDDVLSDLLLFDGTNLTRLPVAGNFSGQRAEAKLAVIGDRLLLVGGKHTHEGAGRDTYPAQLCEIDLKAAKPAWACRYVDGVTTDEKAGVSTQLPLPEPRTAHGVASGVDRSGRPVVVVFGGSEQAARGDTWLFTLPE